MKNFLLSTILLALCAVVYNASAGPNESLGYHEGVGLDAVALNGAPATRTFEIDTRRYVYGTVTFWISFDYTANAGIISLICTGGPNDDDNDYTLTVCDSASTEGECTAKTSGIFRSAGSLSADTKWDARMGIKGAKSLSCVGSHGGSPGATDKLTVKYIVAED